MRLLFVVPYAPTPIRTRPYFLLNNLVKQGHRLTLATLWSDASEQAACAQWPSDQVSVIAKRLTRGRSLLNLVSNAFGRAPWQAAYCWQPELAHALEQLVARESFDAVHVEHLRGAWYALAIKRALASNPARPPVVWDSVDSIANLFEQAGESSARRASRLIARAELGRTRAYEPELVAEFDRTLVVAEDERKAFRALLAARADLGAEVGERVTVIPNGVDLDYFAPRTTPRDPATIVLSGKMSYHANVSAALFLLDEVLPRVHQQVPAARVIIVGQNPPSGLRERANDKIQVTGTVPDLRPYLAQATVACAPMRYGAGVQNKILEAMAMGTATVTTPQAIGALAASAGQDLLVRADAEGLSTALVSVINDAALRQRLEQNGRRYVEQHHRWRDSVFLLEQIYANASNPIRARGN